MLLSRQLWPPAYIQIVPSTQIADIQKRYLPVGMEWGLSLEVVRDVIGSLASVRWIVLGPIPYLRWRWRRLRTRAGGILSIGWRDDGAVRRPAEGRRHHSTVNTKRSHLWLHGSSSFPFLNSCVRDRGLFSKDTIISLLGSEIPTALFPSFFLPFHHAHGE